MSKRPKLKLNEQQERAVEETLSEYAPGYFHRIQGPAGSGKTTSVEEVVRRLLKRGISVAVTAPTHKAVRVLRQKLRAAGLEHIPIRTTQSLLSLRPRQVADRQVFTRAKFAKPVQEAAVVVDECSMINLDMHEQHIRKWLSAAYTIYVGDDAQLPPVGEERSPTFDLKSFSQIETIMRQTEGNPVLAAALMVRAQQGTGKMDWSWMREVDARPSGIFRPDEGRLKVWMDKAFTSPAFEADPDTFRYIAWRNAQVERMNANIRRWRYGDAVAAKTPFVAGESLTFLDPVIKDETTLFMTGQEVKVVDIQEGEFTQVIEPRGEVAGWVASIPSWQIKVLDEHGDELEIHTPRNIGGKNGLDFYKAVLDQLADEARDARDRWDDFQKFKDSVAKVRAIYGMTVHASQGSTFKNVFLDVADIRGCADFKLLECQQLLYTGLTRPTHAAILRGR